MGRKRERWLCNVDGCKKIHLAKGYCHSHYVKFGQEKKCKIEDCNKGHHAKGYCVTHYTRLRKNGNQVVRQRWGKEYSSLEDYLNKNHTKEFNRCWIWTGSFSKRNYGIVGNFSIAKKLKISKAHRLSFLIYKGEIPVGMLVCHTCDNPPCINPDHLFLGTHMDNMKDMDSKGRRVIHKGEQYHKAKLTKAEAIYILKNMETISAWELSTQFNVSRQTIQNIWNGITKYVEPDLREQIINDLYNPSFEGPIQGFKHPDYPTCQSTSATECDHEYKKTLAKSGMYFIDMCHKCHNERPWVGCE